jgi:hypothetical protein
MISIQTWKLAPKYEQYDTYRAETDNHFTPITAHIQCSVSQITMGYRQPDDAPDLPDNVTLFT